MRILCLVTDAFGGHGGISKFNRDLLTAVCSHDQVREVVALPRLMPNPPGLLPERLTYLLGGLNSKARYVRAVIRAINQNPKFDLILCGHVNLIPIAWLCRLRVGCRLGVIVHGIDAWTPNKNPLVNLLVSRVDLLISVSEYTRSRMREWAEVARVDTRILPNCVDLTLFSPGPKNDLLLERYNLRDKVVLMTLGRLDSMERAKGFDEVLRVLPQMAGQIPNLRYLIVGGGSDRQRLVTLAKELGVADRVVFAGLIPEEEKNDHYRLADAYVMPSLGEGFGIVLLEAMACGIPVVGSKTDGSREALRNGALGHLVDPSRPDEIIRAITQSLGGPKLIPAGLDYFSSGNFQARVHALLDSLQQQER